MKVKRRTWGVIMAVAAICEAAVIIFVPRGIQNAVEQNKMAAWGTTLDISLLAIVVPLFVLLVGSLCFWLHDTLWPEQKSH